MIAVSEIAAHFRNEMRDDMAGIKSYSDKEVILYINAGLSWLPSVDSSARVSTQAIQLAQGVVQVLPEGSVRLIDIYTNAIGDTRERIDGRQYKGNAAVRPITQSELTSVFPHWASARETAIVVHTVFNKSDPKSFLVYPPNNGDGKLLCSIVSELSPVQGDTITNQELPLERRYLMPLVHYAVFRALSRDGEDQSSAGKAEAAYAKAQDLMRSGEMADTAETPEDGARA